MRWFLLLASLFSLNLQAEYVIATGYGKTVAEALQNAKTAAVDQVAGTFITGKSTLDGDSYRSRTDQYTGGLIRKQHILSVSEQDSLFVVRIQADVDTEKVNSVIVSDGAEITTQIADKIEKSRDDFEKTRRIVEALDDPAQAFAVRVRKVDYKNRGELTDVIAEVEIVYSPKWYDDVRVMAKTIGRKVDIGSKWADALWGLAALTAAVNPVLPGTMFSLARRAQGNPKPSSEYMVCFGKDNGWDIDECYEIRHPLKNTTGDSMLQVNGSFTQSDEQIRFNKIDVETGHELFLDVYPNRKAYFVKSATERKFHNPGVVLFRKGTKPFLYRFTVPTQQLTQGSRIVFAALRSRYSK